MFELVKKIAGVRRLFSAVVAAATLATVTSIGGVAGAAGTPVFNAPPSAPIYVTATAGNGSVTLNWTTPYYTGGTAQFFGYNVFMGTTAAGESTTPVNGQAPIQANTFTVPNLTNGTKYFFTVTAVNVLGQSPASSEVSATPAGPPGAPTAVTAVASSGQVVLTWTAPASTGGSPILGYNVYCTDVPANATCYNQTFYSADPINNGTLISGLTYTVKGLINGASYQFDVTAVNAIGEGPAGTSNAVTPVGPANAPEYPSTSFVTSTSSSVLVCATDPTRYNGGGQDYLTNGGSAIIGYNFYVGSTPGGESATPANGTQTPVPWSNTGTTCYSVSGLNPGVPYFFQVAAVTAAGVGAKSFEVMQQTHTTVPSVPLTPVVTLVDLTHVSLSWTASASNGGRAITGYNVYLCDRTAVPGCTPSIYHSGVTSPNLLGPLTTGDTYAYFITAVNWNGEGPATATGTFVPGATVPSAPAITHVMTTGSTTASVCWAGSANDGGSGILGYNIYMGTTAGGESATPLNGSLFPSPSCQPVVGLTAGATYYFIVKAVNANGTSGPSNEVSVVANGTTPGAPTSLAVSGGANNSQTLVSSWNAPASNGGDTVGYGVNAYQLCVSTTSGSEYSVPAGYCWTFNGTSNTFNPNILFATNTTVYLAIRAQNSFGYGPWSTEASYVVPSTPSTPGGLTATTYPGQLFDGQPGYEHSGYTVLKWNASFGVGTGFAPVTYQVYDVTDSCTIAYTTATTYLVTGWQYNQSGMPSGGNCNSMGVLTLGSTTQFAIWAVNSMGWSHTGSTPVSVTAGTIPLRAHDSTWGVYSVSSTSAQVVFNTGNSSSYCRDGYGDGWATPCTDGGVTSFVATAWVGSTPWTSCTFVVGGPGNPITDGCTLAGLPNNTFFTTTLQMVNAFGTGYIDSDSFINGPGVRNYNWFATENRATTGAAPILSATSVDNHTVKLTITDPSVFRNNYPETYYVVASLNGSVNSTTGVVVCGENESLGTGGVYSGLQPDTFTATGATCTVDLTNFTQGLASWSVGTPITFAVYSEDNYNDSHYNLSQESNQVTITPANQVPAAPYTDWTYTYNGDPNWQSQGNNGGWTTNDPYICWDNSAGATGYNVYVGTSAGGESTTPYNGAVPIAQNNNCGPNTSGIDLFYLTPGVTYYIIVKAVNATGSSAASNEVSITPPVVPSMPLNVAGTGGDHSVTLNWTAPTSPGTSPFIGYYIYAGTSPNGENSYPVNAVAIQGTSYTVTGLTNGVPYYFFVVAANAAGLSAAAFGEEISVTPQAKATTFTKVTLSAKSAKLGHENNVIVRVSVSGAAVSGNVTVKWAGRTVCSLVLVNGHGSCLMGANSINKTGLRTMTATYMGDDNTLPSTGKASIKITK